jgi:phosphoglycolate phosphatase
MPFATIAFDLDGTLVDTAPDLAGALNHALRELGRPALEPASVRAIVGQGARRLVERGLDATGARTEALVEAGIAAFLNHYRANIAVESRPFPMAEPVLDRLAAAGARLAICTNKPEALARSLLEALGWQGRFTAVLGADSRAFRKPDPRHLLATLAAAGGEPSQSAFVGDSRVDAETAAAARIPFVLVEHGYCAEPLHLVRADARISGLDGLWDALATIQGEFTRTRQEGAP